ncbi:AMIN domain-containing protein [bacterium]|nr:AMIN domain-containing protein [bacterium]
MKHKYLNYTTFLMLLISLLLLIGVRINAEIKREKEKSTQTPQIPMVEYSLNNIKVVEDKETIKIVLENSHLPQYITFLLSNPPRLVINIINANYQCPERNILVNKDQIICVRSSQFQLTPVKISRVVIDLGKRLKHHLSSRDNNIIVSFKKGELEDLCEISSVELKEEKSWISLNIPAFKGIKYDIHKLSNPDKIVVDLKKAILNLKQQEIKVNQAGVDKIRLSQYQDQPEEIVRVVFDLTKEVSSKVIERDGQLQILVGDVEETKKDQEKFAKEMVTTKQETISLSKEMVRNKVSLLERAEKDKEKLIAEKAEKKVLPQEITEVEKPKEVKVKEIPEVDKKEELTNFKKPTSEVVSKKEETTSPDLISLDFRNADIIDVLRIISHKTGINIVASKNVKGTVTIKLDNVTWRNALSVLLQAYDYNYIEEGEIIRVDTKEKLMKEALMTKVFTLKYAESTKLAASLKDMLTIGVGNISVDTRSNAIIITDNFKVINFLDSVIKELDTKTSQVIIEAKIIEVTLSNEERLGINWDVKPLGVKEDVSGEVGVSLSATVPYKESRGYLNLGTIQKGFNINAQISAMMEEGKLDILSNPRIVALNGQEAKIIVGEEVPYKTTTVGTGGTSTEQVSFKEVGIKLIVTPTINTNNYITLKIHPEVSDVKEWKYEMPIISKRESDSLILVKDKETIVIGGLIKDKKIITDYGVPYLRRIPLLGRLFKSKFTETKKTELLIFITPTIMADK